MSTNNYIVTADLSFNGSALAVENIDGNRFAVGGQFTQVTDSTGVLKDCNRCGIFTKQGELDVSFNFKSAYAQTLAYLGDNRLAVGGNFLEYTDFNGTSTDTSYCAIIDINSGELDVSFQFFSRFPDGVTTLTYLGDNKLAVGGLFTKVDKGPQASSGVAMVDTSNCAIVNSETGALDTSFNFSSFSSLYCFVYALADLGNNKLAVGGFFTDGAVKTPFCAIFNSETGALDTSFNFSGRVTALTYLGDDKLAVGGNFLEYTDFNGTSTDTSYCAIIDINSGKLDTSFNFNDIVYTLNYLEDNKLAVGGLFTDLDGDTTTRLAFVNPNDGSLTKSFSNISGMLFPIFPPRVRALADLSDNYLVVGGSFTNMHNDCPGATDGTPCKNLAILNHVDTILKPENKEVPTPPQWIWSNPFFDEQQAKKAAGAEGVVVAGKKPNSRRPCWYVKKPEFCVEILPTIGFNGDKMNFDR